ncbi:unnamed protein product [Meganyctiphanes norvegica]|uniref:Uncharacterized protein n=1 Tax=Meganyctiphanes norvegica TaxID=48144 RepID=A0AAV2QJH8_MEGNR
MARADNDPFNVLRNCTSNGLASAAELLSGLSGTGSGLLTSASLLSGNPLVPNLTGIGGTSGLLTSTNLVSTALNGNAGNLILGNDVLGDDSSRTALQLAKDGAIKDSAGEQMGLKMLSLANGSNGSSMSPSKFSSDSFGSSESESFEKSKTDKGEALRAKGRHLLVDIHGLAVFLRQSTRCLACSESNCLYVTGAICAPLTAITQVTITCQQCKYRTSQPLARPRPQSPDRMTTTSPNSNSQTPTHLSKSGSTVIKIKEEAKLKNVPQNNDSSNSKSFKSPLEEVWVKEEPKSPSSISPNPDNISNTNGSSKHIENKNNSQKENTEVKDISQKSPLDKLNDNVDKLEFCSAIKTSVNSANISKKRKRKNGLSSPSQCKRSTCHRPNLVSHGNSLCNFVPPYPHSQFVPPLFPFSCPSNRYLDTCCTKEVNHKRNKGSKKSKIKREKFTINEEDLLFDCSVDTSNPTQVSTTTLENQSSKCSSSDFTKQLHVESDGNNDKNQTSKENTQHNLEYHDESSKKATKHSGDMEDKTIKGKKDNCKISRSPSHPHKCLSKNPCFDNSHRNAMFQLMNAAQLMNFGSCSCYCRAAVTNPCQRFNNTGRKSFCYSRRQYDNFQKSIKKETEERDDTNLYQNENVMHNEKKDKKEQNREETEQKQKIETRKCNENTRSHCCSQDGGPYGPSWRFHDLLSSESESDSEGGNLMIDTSSSDEDS